jgi:Ca-activated chloride channel homolog
VQAGLRDSRIDMKFVSILVTFVLLLSLGAAAVQPAAENEAVPDTFGNPGMSIGGMLTIRKKVAEVRLLLNVADKANRIVTDVKPEDLTVVDDGVQVSSFTEFGNSADLPLRVGLLLDRSDSVTPELADEKAAATIFLSRIMRPADDRAELSSFGTGITTEQEWTGESSHLLQSISNMHGGGLTAFYDAVYEAARQLGSLAEDAPGRKALIVLSDGFDNVSRRTLDDAVAMAQRTGVTVYTISFRKRREIRGGDETLARLSKETGGRAFLRTDPRRLRETLSLVEQELRTQYVLVYRPATSRADGRFHRLQVAPRGRHLVVRCRTGYFSDNDEELRAHTTSPERR